MKLQRSLIIALIAIIIVVVAVAGYIWWQTTQQAAQTTQTLRFLIVGKGVHPYWSVVAAGVERAEKEIKEKYGVNIDAIFWTPTREESVEQIKGIESYLATGLNGIGVAPVDPSAITPYVQEALNKKIPFITIDTDAPDSGRLAYLGTNNYKGGYYAGMVAYMLAKEKGYIRKGAEVKIGIGVSTVTPENARSRIQGFKDALEALAKADPDIQGDIKFIYIGPYEDKGDPTAAYNYALSILQTNPDLAIAYGVFAYNGPAWAKALKQLGYPPGKVILVEFDVTSDNVPPIIDGYAQVTVGQRQYFMGYYGVWLLYNMTVKGWEQALKDFIPNYPQNKVYDTGVDLVGKTHMEFTTPTGEKIVVLSLSEYKAEMTKLGVDPSLLGLENIP